jgi:hypothetical protein
VPGVRIFHPSLRGAKLLVHHPGDPRVGRLPKDYHIVIDSEGYAIVSDTVWERLQQAKAHGFDGQFIVMNEVLDPPEQRVGFVEGVEVPTYQVERLSQEEQALRELAPQGVQPRVIRR